MTTPVKFNPHARRKARRLALQAIYQWQSAQTQSTEIMAQFLVQQDVKKADMAYFEELLCNIISQHEKLDEQLQPYLSRNLVELDPIERAILRMAMYELTQRHEIPYRVIINEAVELAKNFGGTDGHKFVNGVLDKAAQQVRSLEIKASS